MSSFESKSTKETIDEAMRQFEIGDMKQSMDLFENAKSRIELEMKNDNEFTFEYISIVINKLCIIYCDYLAEFDKALKMNENIIKSIENNNNNTNSSDIYIAALLNKALILEKMDKKEESHIIFNQSKQLFEQQNSSSPKLYVESLFGFARTFSKNCLFLNERKKAWSECLEIAEKSFGKLSKIYLEIVDDDSYFEKYKVKLLKLQEIEKEFESKPELKNSLEFSFCLSAISNYTGPTTALTEYCPRTIELCENLCGKNSLPFLVANQKLHLKLSLERPTNPLLQLLKLEKSMRSLVGIRHPAYFDLFDEIVTCLEMMTDVDSSDDVNDLEQIIIEIPTQPKSTDCKESLILFNNQFWENQSTLSRKPISVQFFRVFRIQFWLHYLTFGLNHSRTISVLYRLFVAMFRNLPDDLQSAMVDLLWILLEPKIDDFIYEYIHVQKLLFDSLSAQSKWNEAFEIVQQTRMLVSKILGEKSTTYAEVLRQEAESFILKQRSNGNKATKDADEEQYWTIIFKAIAVYEELCKDDQNLSISASQFTGFAYFFAEKEKFEEALEHFEKARICWLKSTSDPLSNSFQKSVNSQARDVVYLMVSKANYKDYEEKRNQYLKIFTGRYSAEHCINHLNPQTSKGLIDLIESHSKCGKPLPLSKITFTEGFIEILKCDALLEGEKKKLEEMCISILHHLIAPEITVRNENDLSRICIVPLKVAVNTLRVVRLLKSSEMTNFKLSDRKKVILNNIIETIGMKNSELLNSNVITKHFERILNFGIDRATLGKDRIEFYVNLVSGCSNELLLKYYNLLIDANHADSANAIEFLLKIKQ